MLRFALVVGVHVVALGAAGVLLRRAIRGDDWAAEQDFLLGGMLLVAAISSSVGMALWRWLRVAVPFVVSCVTAVGLVVLAQLMWHPSRFSSWDSLCFCLSRS